MKCPNLSDLPMPPEGKVGWPWTEESPNCVFNRFEKLNYPKISIVTPSYNQGNFIEETIRSVLLQNYLDIEYIIIDGGSTDSSVDIIRKYEPWIKFWVSEPDRGQTHAVNKGFSHCSGEIMAWLNSDDTYEPGTISKVAVSMAKDSSIDVLYGNLTITDENGHSVTEIRTVPFNSKAYLYETVHIISQSAVFWRKEIFQKVGEVDENYSYAMDRDLIIRFAENNAKFHFVRHLLGTYRFHKGAKTSSDISRSEFLTIPQIYEIHKRKNYKFWRSIYRLRQWFFLVLQGDFSYMAFRAFARVRPTGFDKR